MTLLAPGVRTAPFPGWRARVVAAVGVVVGSPALWLLGAMGFAARGGIGLLALPIITIPSPVILSILLQDQLDSTGLTVTPADAFAAAAGIGLVVILPALLLAAFADVASFERTVGDAETEELRVGAPALVFSAPQRRRLILMLAALGAVAIVPLAAALIAATGPIHDAIVQDQTLPGTGELPVAMRVLASVPREMALVVAAALLADLIYAASSRAVLVRAAGLEPHRSRAWAAVTALATAAIAWLATLAVVLPILWATVVAWEGVRNALLTLTSAGDPALLPAVLAAVVVFSAVWVAGIILCGFCSALRAALWSVSALR